MNKTFIFEYIKRIKRDDILKFCNYKNINITDKEVDILYSYIKNDYKRIIDKPLEVINELKDKLSNNTFIEINNLYNQYKNKINF